MFALRKAARFQNVHFFPEYLRLYNCSCMSSSWSLCLMKSSQGGQPVLVKACPTVTPVQPALNPFLTFLTWTARSQTEERLKSTRPFWKPVRQHLIYFCSALRFDYKNMDFSLRTDNNKNHQIKCDIPFTSSEKEAVVVYCWKGLWYKKVSSVQSWFLLTLLVFFLVSQIFETENYKGSVVLECMSRRFV